MAEKLGINATLPPFSLTLTDGEQVAIPDDLGSGYKIILFYRGHW